MLQNNQQLELSPKYINLLINTVNNNPSSKNVLKMQIALNSLNLGDNSIREDGILGNETRQKVKDWRAEETKIREANYNARQREIEREVEIGRATYEAERTERLGSPEYEFKEDDVFDFLKDDEPNLMSPKSKKDK